MTRMNVTPGDQSDAEPHMESEFNHGPRAAEWRSAAHPGGAAAHGHRGIR